MSLYQEQLKEILSYYQSILGMYQSDLDHSPPGTLACQTHYGKDQFLHIYRQNGLRHRKVITNDISVQQALARKEFAKKALEVLEPNVQILESAVNNMVPFDPDSLLASMTKGYSKLPEEFFFDRNSVAVDLHLSTEMEAKINRHKSWGRTPYHESSYYQENKVIRTSRGQNVRSKSEALILEMNYRFDVDVHYDEEFLFGNDIIIPDFTYEGADGRPFFWEHMGMMDHPGYAAHNYEKLQKYYKAGILLGDRLILTFDRNGIINMGMIEATIKHEVLPRL